MGWRGPRNQLGAGSKERLGTHSSMAESGMGARRPTGDLGIALPADFEENGTQFSEEHEQQMQRLALVRGTKATRRFANSVTEMSIYSNKLRSNH